MRLLNVRTEQLGEFFGDQIPPYAILSHTWGTPEEEVNFEDLDLNRYKHKSGYQKIQYLCQQAKIDKLSWAWCDTYCIDKRSSAELSEEINSMFRLYQNAKVCYAYLSDILSCGGRDQVLKDFPRSRWFTRGWTLQELLAPEDVRFFTEDWTYFGTKKELEKSIRATTGINLGALLWPWTILDYSIATRLSWASGRTTTRIEDRTYSMLGILGVHMFLLYGEGQNAFQRLQTELIRLSADESVFAHLGPNLLAESPDAFGSAKSLDFLPSAAQPLPYQMTNVGLNIQIRIFRDTVEEKIDSPTAPVYGILNCYEKEDFQNYTSIPLLATQEPSTFIRAPGAHRIIPESIVKAFELRSIFILLRPPRISRVRCWLERLYFPPSVYSCSIECNSRVSLQGGYTRITIIFEPSKNLECEILRYRFRDKSGGSFDLDVIFDLIDDGAGVLVLGARRTESFSRNGVFELWKKEGRPTQMRCKIENPQTGTGKSIIAEIKRELRLHQPLWNLRLEMLHEEQ